MKIIFLDVDGVLNHSHSIGWKNSDGALNWRVLDPDCIFEINRIIRETGAKIVMISTWRFNDEGMALIKESLIDGSIIGSSPTLQRMSQHVDRRFEILEWMSKIWPHSLGCTGEKMEKIAVLDDDNDADLGDGSFFKTDFESGGLTKEIADDIIQHLNRNEVLSQGTASGA